MFANFLLLASLDELGLVEQALRFEGNEGAALLEEPLRILAEDLQGGVVGSAAEVEFDLGPGALADPIAL